MGTTNHSIQILLQTNQQKTTTHNSASPLGMFFFSFRWRPKKDQKQPGYSWEVLNLKYKKTKQKQTYTVKKNKTAKSGSQNS